jgi:hypothetical protein
MDISMFRGPEIDWSRRPKAKRRHPPAQRHKLWLLRLTEWDKSVFGLFFSPDDGKEIWFELGTDQQRAAMRTDMLRAGVFKIPA